MEERITKWVLRKERKNNSEHFESVKTHYLLCTTPLNVFRFTPWGKLLYLITY